MPGTTSPWPRLQPCASTMGGQWCKWRDCCIGVADDCIANAHPGVCSEANPDAAHAYFERARDAVAAQPGVQRQGLVQTARGHHVVAGGDAQHARIPLGALELV